MKFPDEVEAVGAFGLLGVQQESDGGSDSCHDVYPLLVPIDVAFVSTTLITVALLQYKRVSQIR